MRNHRLSILIFLVCVLLLIGFIGCTPQEDDNEKSLSDPDDASDDDDNDDATGDDDSNDDDDDATDCDENHPDWTVGLLYCTPDSTDGYTLFAPMFSTTTYLIDIHGRLVHSWESDHFPGLSAYLLEDGSLLRTVNIGDDSIFISEGLAGGFELRDWDGELLWKYDYNSSLYSSHHDIEMLPNGNVLMIAWQRKSFEEAIDAGLKVTKDLTPLSRSNRTVWIVETLSGNGIFGITWFRITTPAKTTTE